MGQVVHQDLVNSCASVGDSSNVVLLLGLKQFRAAVFSRYKMNGRILSESAFSQRAGYGTNMHSFPTPFGPAFTSLAAAVPASLTQAQFSSGLLGEFGGTAPGMVIAGSSIPVTAGAGGGLAFSFDGLVSQARHSGQNITESGNKSPNNGEYQE